MTACMSVMPYIKIAMTGKVVTAPIKTHAFMMIGTLVRGLGISSAMCVAASEPPYANLEYGC